MRFAAPHAVALLLAINMSSASGQNESLVRGLVTGCIDAQERQIGRPLTSEDKRFVLHYCHCQAAAMVPLASDMETVKKSHLKDKTTVDAVQRINAVCTDAVRRGRMFAPGLT